MEVNKTKISLRDSIYGLEFAPVCLTVLLLCILYGFVPGYELSEHYNPLGFTLVSSLGICIVYRKMGIGESICAIGDRMFVIYRKDPYDPYIVGSFMSVWAVSLLLCISQYKEEFSRYLFPISCLLVLSTVLSLINNQPFISISIDSIKISIISSHAAGLIRFCTKTYVIYVPFSYSSPANVERLQSWLSVNSASEVKHFDMSLSMVNCIDQMGFMLIDSSITRGEDESDKVEASTHI